MSILRFVLLFYNDPATPEIYTLPLHDALPISCCVRREVKAPNPHPSGARPPAIPAGKVPGHVAIVMDGNGRWADRKSTRLNSSHANISYAVFCLKQKNKITYIY